jgi:sugar phosphate isomerase/epimerase
MMMYYTGFADEAAKGIDGQVKATRQLSWSNIEARNIDGQNIIDLPKDKFDLICEKLKDAGIKVNCIGSAIANWGKSIEEPFEPTVEETKRAVERMKKLDCKMIRIMSYAILKGRQPDDQMKEQRFERLRKICSLFTDNDILPVHENCQNFGGMGYTFTLELIENVPGLKLVFDTGNPVFSADRTKSKPYPMQDSLEFYKNVKAHIAYVHIKDVVYKNGKEDYTFPGEGDGHVKEILSDLLSSGYEGGISIEPHMAVVLHDKSVTSSEDKMYENYIEYGQRLMRLVKEIKESNI